MSLDEIKPFINWLHSHPSIATIFTFIIAFSESIAVIGLVVPGSLILMAIGTLIGSGILSAPHTIAAAIIGAIAGDFFSYWFGHHYQHHVRKRWPFRLWPGMIKKGEDFFNRHGGKGVFLGRFVG